MAEAHHSAPPPDTAPYAAQPVHAVPMPYQQPGAPQFPLPPPADFKPRAHAFVDDNRTLLVGAAFGLALLSFLFQIFILSIVGNMHSRIFGS